MSLIRILAAILLTLMIVYWCFVLLREYNSLLLTRVNRLHIPAIELGEFNIDDIQVLDVLLRNNNDYRNDMQNTHDSNVIDGMKKRLERIIELNNNCPINWPQTKSQILSAAKNHLANVGNVERVIKHIDITQSKIESYKSILGHDNNEIRIICEVWNRINSPDNAQKKDDLILSLLVELNECVENDNVVCVNGRVGHILDSLTCLDVNPEVAKPEITREMLKTEILAKCSELFYSELHKLEKDDPQTYKKYQNNETTTGTETFEKQVQKKMIDLVNDYDLPAKTKTYMIQECLAAIK